MRAMDTKAAYRDCAQLARTHYENFPVASRLLPARMRRPVSAIYAFARTADDLADEGDAPPEARLAALDDYGARLDAAVSGRPDADPVFVALADAIPRHGLPPGLFHDLLHAFRMDVTKKRFADFGEVMGYCRYSANPVGRLLLHVSGDAEERNLAYSDAICSALQLINFLQDLTQDYDENDRIYLPEDEMRRFGVGEAHIRERVNDFAMRSLIDKQVRRTRGLLEAGAPLGLRLRGRFGFEIRTIVMGGSRVLQHLHENREDVFARPRLGPRDWLWMFGRAALAPLRGR